MSFKRSFLIGLGAGVALGMLALEAWTAYVSREKFEAAQVHLRIPNPDLSERLPRPRLPEASSTPRDDWQLETIDGRPARLADFRGKVVFVDFWTTSCAPCLAEMPGIERLAASLKDQPVAFLAVTREDGRKVRQFLEANQLSLPVYLAQEPPPESLGAVGVPTTVILDRNGVAVFHHVGALNWDDDGARSYIRGLASQTPPSR